MVRMGHDGEGMRRKGSRRKGLRVKDLRAKGMSQLRESMRILMLLRCRWRCVVAGENICLRLRTSASTLTFSSNLLVRIVKPAAFVKIHVSSNCAASAPASRRLDRLLPWLAAAPPETREAEQRRAIDIGKPRCP